MTPIVTDRLATEKNATGSGEFYPYGEQMSASSDTYGTYKMSTRANAYYARNRWYDSAMGRFTTPDPYGGSATLTNPNSWNRYAYAGNDPVNFTDPSGLCSPDDSPPCYSADGVAASQNQYAYERLYWSFLRNDPRKSMPISEARWDPPVSQRIGRAETDQLHAQMNASRRRLLNDMTDDCAGAIGAGSLKGATDRLRGIRLGATDLGQLKVLTDSNGAVVGVAPGQEVGQYSNSFFGMKKSIELNSQVNWSDPNSTIAVDQNGNQVTYALLNAEAFELSISSMTPNQYMDFIVLHELAHSFGQDHPKGSAGAYNRNIWSHCFK